jgi:hypothetical protein
VYSTKRRVVSPASLYARWRERYRAWCSQERQKSVFQVLATADPLRANIDETVPPVIITEQGENRHLLEDQRNLFGFPHGFARRAT